MRKKTTEPRIVVTVDSGTPAAPAIDLAAALAKTRKLALRGLFIEDEDLLKVARLPFSREVLANGRQIRSLSGGELERGMARLAGEFRNALESAARQQSLHWSFSSLRCSRRLVTRREETLAELLVIGRPSAAAAHRPPRILLLNGDRPAVIEALASVLEAPGYAEADLLVHGPFNAEALNGALAGHPGVTRRLMGAPSLPELLTGARYRPGLVLLARDADPADLDACLGLADCPVVLAA